MKRIVVGISGSSAPILGVRLLEVLAGTPEVETHLVLSDTVPQTLAYEAPDWSVDKLKALATKHYPNDQLAAAISKLSERDRTVIVLYYLEGMTLAQIAQILDVTESRVSQLHTRAVLALRTKLRASAHPV